MTDEIPDFGNNVFQKESVRMNCQGKMQKNPMVHSLTYLYQTIKRFKIYRHDNRKIQPQTFRRNFQFVC